MAAGQVARRIEVGAIARQNRRAGRVEQGPAHFGDEGVALEEQTVDGGQIPAVEAVRFVIETGAVVCVGHRVVVQGAGVGAAVNQVVAASIAAGVSTAIVSRSELDVLRGGSVQCSIGPFAAGRIDPEVTSIPRGASGDVAHRGSVALVRVKTQVDVVDGQVGISLLVVDDIALAVGDGQGHFIAPGEGADIELGRHEGVGTGEWVDAGSVVDGRVGMVVPRRRVRASGDVDFAIVHAQAEGEDAIILVGVQHEGLGVTAVDAHLDAAPGRPVGIHIEVVAPFGHASIGGVVASVIVGTDERVDVSVQTGEVARDDAAEDVAVQTEGVEPRGHGRQGHQVVVAAVGNVEAVAAVDRGVRIVIEGVLIHAAVDRRRAAVAFPLEIGAGTLQLAEVVERDGEAGEIIVAAHRLVDIGTIAGWQTGAVVECGVRVEVRGFGVRASQNERFAVVLIDPDRRDVGVHAGLEGDRLHGDAVQQDVHGGGVHGVAVVNGHRIAAIGDAPFGDPFTGVVDVAELGRPIESVGAHDRVGNPESGPEGVGTEGAVGKGQRARCAAVDVVLAAAVDRGRGVKVARCRIEAAVGVDRASAISASAAAATGPVVVGAVSEADAQCGIVSGLQGERSIHETKTGKVDGDVGAIPSVAKRIKHLQHIAGVLEAGGDDFTVVIAVVAS